MSKKKSNKLMIAVICICLALVISLVCLLAFIDPISGKIKLSKVREAAEQCTEIVISDPLHDESFYRGAEAILTDDEVRELAKDFLDVTENVSYHKSLDASKGFWDLRIDFCVGEEKHTVYLKEDSVYVVGKSGYLFKINEKATSKYADFYGRIVEKLSNVDDNI